MTAENRVELLEADMDSNDDVMVSFKKEVRSKFDELESKLENQTKALVTFAFTIAASAIAVIVTLIATAHK